VYTDVDYRVPAIFRNMCSKEYITFGQETQQNSSDSIPVDLSIRVIPCDDGFWLACIDICDESGDTRTVIVDAFPSGNPFTREDQLMGHVIERFRITTLHPIEESASAI